MCGGGVDDDGRYATSFDGVLIVDDSSLIHDFYTGECERPVHLVVDTALKVQNKKERPVTPPYSTGLLRFSVCLWWFDGLLDSKHVSCVDCSSLHKVMTDKSMAACGALFIILRHPSMTLLLCSHEPTPESTLEQEERVFALRSRWVGRTTMPKMSTNRQQLRRIDHAKSKELGSRC